MDHLEISEAALVGHSIGGQMVTRFAFSLPRSNHAFSYSKSSWLDGQKGRSRL